MSFLKVWLVFTRETSNAGFGMKRQEVVKEALL